ncbi:MAG: decaprenyl-phosphate phosphoribosyltransferase [Spirochaetales bacterium]|nr:decaprenyl-phosphate phosphoribosyltransferase [Spirochaetales bacterium]
MRDYIRLLRVKHWIKNMFVLIPLIFSKKFLLADQLFEGLLASGLVFVLFCLGSSFSYIINDIVDRKKDREHPVKKSRPLASGKVSVRTAGILAGGVLAICIAAVLFTDIRVMIAFGCYILLILSYSFFLKHFVIADVIVIAVGFIIRIIAGALAIDVGVSNWLLLSALFLSLFLGFGKRRHDLLLLENKTAHRPVLDHYTVPLLDSLITVSVALVIITYSLYTLSEDTAERFNTSYLIYTVPLVVFGIFRYLYILYKKEGGGDPADIVLCDKSIVIVVALWGLLIIGILFLGSIGYGRLF